MIPAIMTGGRSFKGAARYYLHDKGADSAERVAWVETVNLPTADPDKAWRMMAHTAMTQDELKAAAGIKATGRKLNAPVFSYSLSWHPTETPSREDMAEAARETLAVLGLEGHQAMIVCHSDEPHAHVHILVNRVSPVNGVAATLSLSKRKLSDWALAYEKKRGTVFVEKRAENAEKRARGEQTYDPRVSRDQFEMKAANDNLTAEFIRAEWKRRAAALFQQERDLNKLQAAEFRELKRFYDAERQRTEDAAKAERLDREVDIRLAYKPRWAELFRQQRDERAKFERRERTPLGTIWNMAQAARELSQGTDRQKRHTREAAESNAFGILFAIASRDQRLYALERRHERQRRELGSSQRLDVRRMEGKLRASTRAALDVLRQGLLKGTNRLRQAHEAQRTAMQDGWARFRKERDKAFGQISNRKKRNKAKMEGIEFKTLQEPTHPSQLKETFKKSATKPKGFGIDADAWVERANKSKRGRNRNRNRTPGGL